MLCGPCLKACENKTEYGYCRTTACINPKYNGGGTYVSNHTEMVYPNALNINTVKKEIK